MSEPIRERPEPAQRLAERFSLRMADWYRETQPQTTDQTEALLKRAAKEASLATAEGHVCADLGEWSEEDRADLLKTGLVAGPSNTDLRPLILDEGGRLYLQRYFQLERDLAKALMALAKPLESSPSQAAIHRLNGLFPNTGDGGDWQKVAAAMALLGRLTIISGGPGTGKTTTVIKLLACLLTDRPDYRIALAAPTGKAAARMVEALSNQADRLVAEGSLPKELASRLPRQAGTLHRLLGVRPEGGFRHDRDHPLAIDVLVVDESSMLDLALAARLVEALPPGVRLILLGDKDQLAAVEAGAVFAEIAADSGLTPGRLNVLARLTGLPERTLQPPPPLRITPLEDTVIWFSRNYRFHEAPGIAELASRLKDGRGDDPRQEPPALAWLKREERHNVSWLADEGEPLSPELRERLIDGYEVYRAALPDQVTEETDLDGLFAAFNRFRVLCAIRETSRGLRALNRLIGEALRRRSGPSGATALDSEWYPGRPVMVLRNDYSTRLFNGDIGLTLPGSREGDLQVYFPAEGKGSYRALPLSRLPEHETAFAMTVHKSQGSEFDRVVLILPAVTSRVVTRELIYTGITRARSQICLVSSESVLRQGIEKQTARRSGLLERLRESLSESGRADSV